VYPTLLFLLLTALAGVIAYAGDVLGAMVGRRRLSLFGWRPKRTGRVVGIAAGVLIMLSTLGILSLAFRGATEVLLRSQRTARELQTLRAQQSDLEAQVVASQSDLAEARRTSAEAESARDLAREARDAALRTRSRILESNLALSLTNESLAERNASLTEQNAELESNINNVQNQVVTLQNELQELRQESNREAANLSDRLRQFEVATGSELTYRKGEIVHQGLVSAQQSGQILEELRRFVLQAQEAVTARGGSDVELRTDQLRGLTDAVAATPGSDLIVLVAADNFIGPARVEVDVEAYENLKLIREGQLIASRQIHVGSAGTPLNRTALRTEVARLTQQSLERLQRIGLSEQVRPTPSEDDFDSFTGLLAQLSGPVRIGAVAHANVHVAGPAEIEFVILY
jgi:uncharacterized protein (DUF3084 family)